jgi:phospholipid/cholesterol/gamma-HCH transport system substrate-binding protein
MIEQAKNVIIGVFVLIACFIIVMTLLFLHPSTGDDRQILHVRFADIDKVTLGTRVTFAGKPVGEVTGIRQIKMNDDRYGPVDGNGYLYVYQLTLHIDSNIKVFNTDQISLRTSGLLGERSVAIMPLAPTGTEKSYQVTEKNIMYATQAGSVEDTMKEFKEVADKVELALDAATKTIQEIQKQELVEKITATVENVQSITAALNKPERLDKILKDLETLMDEINERLPASWDALDHTLTSAGKVADKAQEVMATTLTIVDDIQAGKGSLGKILKRDDLYLQAKAILGKFDTLTNDVNHYGLLFHLDKGWQRMRARNMNLYNKLSTPQEFRNYFNDEVDQISTSLSRVALVLEKTEATCPHLPISGNLDYQKVFAELLRRTEILEESIRMYNEQAMETEFKKTELNEARGSCP